MLLFLYLSVHHKPSTVEYPPMPHQRMSFEMSRYNGKPWIAGGIDVTSTTVGKNIIPDFFIYFYFLISKYGSDVFF